MKARTVEQPREVVAQITEDGTPPPREEALDHLDAILLRAARPAQRHVHAPHAAVRPRAERGLEALEPGLERRERDQITVAEAADERLGAHESRAERPICARRASRSPSMRAATARPSRPA